MKLTHDWGLQKLAEFVDVRLNDDSILLVSPSKMIEWETGFIFAHPSGESSKISTTTQLENFPSYISPSLQQEISNMIINLS